MYDGTAESAVDKSQFRARIWRDGEQFVVGFERSTASGHWVQQEFGAGQPSDAGVIGRTLRIYETVNYYTRRFSSEASARAWANQTLADMRARQAIHNVPWLARVEAEVVV